MTAARDYLEHAENLPIPGEVDWADAPGVFKLYRGGARLALGYDPTPAPPDGALSRDQLGQLLADCYGLTRQRWTATNALRRVIGTRGASVAASPNALDGSTLRPVASGGARFPGELYVVADRRAGIPAGVYHYDPAHHALVTLRPGDGSPTLAAGLGAAPAPVTILLSILFWKNAFKYGELSYRLCSLDGGALLGQLVSVAARHRPVVHYQFVDGALDDLLGLDASRESVYAAIAIGDAPPVPSAPSAPSTDASPPPATTSTRSTAEQRWSVAALPRVARVHEAARIRSPAAFVPAGALPPLAFDDVPVRRSIALPERRLDLLAGLRRRRSSMGYFERGTLSLAQVGELLGAAGSAYRNDLDGPDSGPGLRHTALFCVLNDVADLEPGVYRYRAERHALDQIRAGDLRGELQASLLSAMFNLFHAAMCVYPVGDFHAGFAVHGDRWYRIQNLEAGIALERLYLAAAALGLRCHASLGYHMAHTNQLLGLGGRPVSSLIQLLVGHGRDPGDYFELPCGP